MHTIGNAIGPLFCRSGHKYGSSSTTTSEPNFKCLGNSTPQLLNVFEDPAQCIHIIVNIYSLAWYCTCIRFYFSALYKCVFMHTNSIFPISLCAFLVFLYIHSFFKTVRREWSNLDRLRMDKFYMVSFTDVSSHLSSLQSNCSTCICDVPI